MQCLIVAGGRLDCCDDPEGIDRRRPARGPATADGTERLDALAADPLSATTPSSTPAAGPSRARPAKNWLGTDDTKRDVLARVIYGFRLSVLSR